MPIRKLTDDHSDQLDQFEPGMADSGFPALIGVMFAVFASFVAGDSTEIKMFGLGLATAVLDGAMLRPLAAFFTVFFALVAHAGINVLTGAAGDDDLAGFGNADLLWGGAAMPEAVATKLQDKCKLTFLEGYGLSETSPVATSNRLDTSEFTGTIGLPIPSTDIAIRDDGDGVGQEEFDEALQQVCHSQKTHGKLGRFGIGLISPLDKCERSTFTSCPNT